MNNDEHKRFIQAAFVAFPGLREWVNEKSPEPAKTIAAWSKALANVSIEDAMQVLDGWVAGTLADPPVGFRRELFALDVRACSQRIREARNKEVRRDEIRQADRNYKSATRNYAMAPAMAKIFDLVAHRDAGLISQEELDTQVDAIVADGCREIDRLAAR
jgi:hypothetical protein